MDGSEACKVAIQAALEVLGDECDSKQILAVSENTYDRLGWLGTKIDTPEDVIKRILDVCESKIDNIPIEPRVLGERKYPRVINIRNKTRKRFLVIASHLEYRHDRSYKYRNDLKHEHDKFMPDQILSRLLDCYEQIPEVKEQIRLAHINANHKPQGWPVTWQGHEPSTPSNIHVQENTKERLIILRMGEYSYISVLELLLDCYEQIPEVKEQTRLAIKIANGDLLIRERKSKYNIGVTMEIVDRLNLLGTIKDTIDDILRRMLDSCEDRVFKELKRRLSVKPAYETLVDAMRRQYNDPSKPLPGLRQAVV